MTWYSLCVENIFSIYVLDVIVFFFTRYREHVVWGDKDVKIKLLRKGILTRINAPMVRVLFNVLAEN